MVLVIVRRTILKTSPGLAVFLMASPKLEMSVSFPCMIRKVDIRDFCKEWTWIFGKRVEGEPVDNHAQDVDRKCKQSKANSA